jgi:hypothetical protein
MRNRWVDEKCGVMGEGWGNAPHSQEYWGSGISCWDSETVWQAGNVVVESDGECFLTGEATGGVVDGKGIAVGVGDCEWDTREEDASRA